MIVVPPEDIITFDTAAAFETWLQQNVGRTRGAWLRLSKKGAPTTTVTYDEALDIGLCWGWIDGQKKSLDEFYFLQKFTPRRARSIWSQRNVKKVEQLIKQGRMQPSGLAEIQAAQADGRWEAAYSGSKDMSVPEDLLAALSPSALEFFKTLNKSNLFAIGFRLHTANTVETRARRLEKLIGQLERGEKLV